MRDLKANSRELWYANYLGEVAVLDENGDMTGDKKPSYTAPVKFMANLSATRGTQGFTGTGASYDYFGADIKYDLIISTAIMDLPINEYTLIWTSEPALDGNGDVDYTKADFTVKAVAHGIYHMKYAIRSLQHSYGE